MLRVDIISSTNFRLCPRQRSETSFTAYMSQWIYYLHMQLLQGIFCSDCYFIESFVQNLHSVYNNNVKPLLITFVCDLPPDSYVPANLVTYLCQATHAIGIGSLTASSTPHDFANQCSWSSSPCLCLLCQIQDTPPTFDICQLSDIDDDLYLAVCSLMQTAHTCNLCAAFNHLTANCSKAQAFLKDPHKSCHLLHLL